MCRDCKPELQMMYAGSKLALVEQVPLDATEMNMNLLVKLCCNRTYNLHGPVLSVKVVLHTRY